MRPGTLVLVDEASLAGTLALDRIVAQAAAAGAVVRLVGDHHQLDAVQAGGALRLLATDAPVAELSEVRRFTAAWEGPASLRLRAGDSAVIQTYLDHGRILPGDRETLLQGMLTRWAADTAAGKDSLLIAADRDTVTELNARARAHRVSRGEVSPTGATLADGTTAGVGDLIATRANDRRLTTLAGKDFVKNRDVWTVLRAHPDGALTVAHTDHHGVLTLPADYVAAHVELGYASTAHGAQGRTVDTSRALITNADHASYAYVSLTRGRATNEAYVVVHPLVDLDADHAAPAPRDVRAVLGDVLARDPGQRSATEILREAFAAADGDLAGLAARYHYAADLTAIPALAALLDELLPPGQAGAAAVDPALGALAHTLTLATPPGGDQAQVLADALAYRNRPLGDAESIPQALVWRLQQLIDEQPDRYGPAAAPLADAGLPDAASVLLGPPPHTGGPADGLLEDYLTHLRTQISGQAEALGEAAVQAPPDWALNALGPLPADPTARAVWQHTTGVLAAYRQTAAVTGPHPLGPRPASPALPHQQAAHARTGQLLRHTRDQLADAQASAARTARLAELRNRLAPAGLTRSGTAPATDQNPLLRDSGARPHTPEQPDRADQRLPLEDPPDPAEYDGPEIGR